MSARTIVGMNDVIAAVLRRATHGMQLAEVAQLLDTSKATACRMRSGELGISAARLLALDVAHVDVPGPTYGELALRAVGVLMDGGAEVVEHRSRDGVLGASNSAVASLAAHAVARAATELDEEASS